MKSLVRALAAAAALSIAGSALAQEKVVLGMSGWTGFQPLKLAELAGIFKKNGVDIEIRFIPPVQRSAALARPYGTGGVYPNFPEDGLDDLGAAYYGANTERLRAIGARYGGT